MRALDSIINTMSRLILREVLTEENGYGQAESGEKQDIMSKNSPDNKSYRNDFNIITILSIHFTF